MIFCTDTHFIHEYSNKIILNRISFTKSLILPTTTNESITGYSTVKIERVSDQYYYYYNFLEIEQRTLNLLLLCIGL